MSLTNSNKKKNYSNISNGNKNKVIRDKSDKNIEVAGIDKKTTLSSILGKKKGYVTKTNNKKPFNIKKIILDNSADIIKFKKK